MNKIDTFLRKYSMDLEEINDNEFVKSFLSEMELGLESSSSLKMIPSCVYDNLKFLNNKKEFIVLDAGGTNLRGAVATIRNGKLVFKNTIKEKLFDLSHIYTCDEFYSSFSNVVEKLSEKPLDIGFCFSFETLIDENLDGTVLNLSKGIQTEGVIGTKVGEELNKRLKTKRQIKIINDTVAGILGLKQELREEGNYIAYILGTGTNACFYEKINNIKKQHTNIKCKEVINIETAGFDKFKIGKFEKDLLNETDGRSQLEKTCGGVYFARIINKVLNCANKEGVVNLTKEIDLELKDYSSFVKNINDLKEYFKTNDDANSARIIIKKLIKRIAKINALVVSAIIEKMNSKDRFFISTEGTTFKHLPSFEYYFKKFVNERHTGIEIKYIKSRNLNFKGSFLIINQ